ncbi:MAG: transcriptional regulator NrdR [Christensenellales bacterium]
MRCIYCGCENSKVIDSRALDETNSIRRRRECENCGKRFTTYESVETTPVLVVKRNGERQPFYIAKVKNGIIKACEKRPVSIVQIDEMVSNIEKKVQGRIEKEINSSEIGELVMNELEKVDKVAYVRFASVYKQFEDLAKFKEFIQKLAGGE